MTAGNNLSDKKNIVKILWTGGYDSSFRIVQLSMRPVEIQPYYVSDNRETEQAELLAIKKITTILKQKPTTACRFLPLQIVNMNQRMVNHQISKSYKNLRKTDFIATLSERLGIFSRKHVIGTQYEWLGIFSKQHPAIELSIHEDDKAVHLIKQHGSFKLISDEFIGEYAVIDKSKSSADINNVFGNFRFPIVNYTKSQMKEEYRKYGCDDIKDITWFCYSPINSKACGFCNPCIYSIEEGMAERFSLAAMKRYNYKNWYRVNYKVHHIFRKLKFHMCK